MKCSFCNKENGSCVRYINPFTGINKNICPACLMWGSTPEIIMIRQNIAKHGGKQNDRDKQEESRRRRGTRRG